MENGLSIKIEYSDKDEDIKYEISLDTLAKDNRVMGIPLGKVINNNEALYKVMRIAMDEVDRLQEIAYNYHYPKNKQQSTKLKSK